MQLLIVNLQLFNYYDKEVEGEKNHLYYFRLPFLTSICWADGPYGTMEFSKKGIMDGNLVRTMFFNYGMVSNWPDQPSCEWPKGSGHSYVDGVAIIVMGETEAANGETIHIMSTQYREFMDTNPETYDPMGWAPVPGWANPDQDSPAMSDEPGTWPDSWPDHPDGSWDGYWNGYFGKGVKNADLETVFLMDDAIDSEFQIAPYYFYPDPSDSLRGGMGLQVETRGFQWAHVLAEDCIFWHYAIQNISATNYENMLFGMYIDSGVGGTDDSSDDAGSYDLDLDIAYAWDGNGVGSPGGWSPVGYAGYAFLESPGNDWDGIDNDGDGDIDERRDDGIDNDGDWRAFTDINGDGDWDDAEPLNDDLGQDGIGPLNDGYDGPDPGQGDGLPTAGEPNFDQTDKDESDQIGLTGFRIFAVHDYELVHEEENWDVLSDLVPPTDEQLQGVNLGMFFSSGLFPLNVGETQRFSMALLFGENYDDIVRNKKTVQAIYDANYNFSRPPEKPTLTAIPGDGKVYLFWDDVAEESYDRFLQEYDFEGYRIYRSTEPTFLENRLITDSYGNLVYRKPIDQFDIDNEWYGPHLIGVYGAHFDVGDNTGLQHFYIDEDVVNGQTYYYGLVSFDHGFISRDVSGNIVFDYEDRPMGISPTECTSTIIVETSGETKLDINTAVVVPRAAAAGYVSPEITNFSHTGPGTGELAIEILAPSLIEEGRRYRVTFSDDSTLVHQTRTFEIFDLENGQSVTGPVETNLEETASPIFDNLVAILRNDIQVFVTSFYGEGESNSNIIGGEYDFDPNFTSDNEIMNLNIANPVDYEIRFFDQMAGVSTALFGLYQEIDTRFQVWDITNDEQVDFLYWPTDTVIAIIPLIDDPTAQFGVRTAWRTRLYPPRDEELIWPGDGFKLVLTSTKPFRQGDVFEFETRKAYLDQERAENELDNIA
ncbi:MAG: hypothetical protein GY869_31115, partial [Planctomycetes bacterium]|nr:hypothetical protein [Planctomycetota bacterium]